MSGSASYVASIWLKIRCSALGLDLRTCSTACQGFIVNVLFATIQQTVHLRKLQRLVLFPIVLIHIPGFGCQSQTPDVMSWQLAPVITILCIPQL